MPKIPVFLAAVMLLLAGRAGPAIGFPASGDPAATKFVGGYLSRLRGEKAAVFYSECYLKQGGKAGVVIPIGKREGMYIETDSDGTVANTADMAWIDGQWQTEVTQGGVYTITRANNLIGELLGYPFLVILPNWLDSIRTSRPTKACLEKLPQ